MISLSSQLVKSVKSLNHLTLRLLSTQKSSIGKKKFRLPVEQDASKLVNYVCGSNIYQDGEDIKLKDDDQYPEWIWKMNVSTAPTPKDYDPKTKEFWEFIEIRHLIRQYRLRANRPNHTVAMGRHHKDYEERILRSQYKAIIPEAIDHGYDPKQILEEPVDPRIHLKPAEDEEVVPFDRVEAPPLFDKISFYRSITKNVRTDKIVHAATHHRRNRPKHI